MAVTVLLEMILVLDAMFLVMVVLDLPPTVYNVQSIINHQLPMIQHVLLVFMDSIALREIILVNHVIFLVTDA